MEIGQTCFVNLTTSAKEVKVLDGVIKAQLYQDYFVVGVRYPKSKDLKMKLFFGSEVYPTRNRATIAAEAAQAKFKANAIDKAVATLNAYAPHLLIGE